MQALTHTINLRTNSKIKKSLESYSKRLHISKSKIANDALSMYIDLRLPQLLDLQEAVSYADDNEFSTDREVEILFKKLLKSKNK
jgi:predicted transcriptional regulator